MCWTRPRRARKARYIAAYGGDPGWECHDDAGCGDYSQGGTHALTSRKGWARSTHPRYPGPLPASATDRTGRIVAYGVLGTRAVRWQESARGSGHFGAPRNLGGGPLAPALSAVVDAPSAATAGTPLPHFTGYAPVTARLAAEPGGRPVPVLLGMDDNGRAQVQFGPTLDARPLPAPNRPATVGTPSLLTPHGRPLAVVGMSPDATPWIWRPQTAPRA
ncbi:hypothetical protein KY5_6456 [Streptomyces formicae]|uniref:Uncharacterized protein n=1 Tax=Streptomyces formicae TaxID=1616117 RepID=A0A291QJ15_9ACTN|nr:hypothetical protein KY5_6456 [Streptomyces formicae]